jgi:hypothetical protein
LIFFLFFSSYRGTGPNEYKGNVKFRNLVREVLKNADLTRLNGKLKASLAEEILHAVKSQDGRFLKIASNRTSSGIGQHHHRRYVVVPDTIAVDKIKQSFRHQLRVLGVDARSVKTVNNGDGQSSPGIPASIITTTSGPVPVNLGCINDNTTSTLRQLLDGGGHNSQILETKLLTELYASQLAAASLANRVLNTIDPVPTTTTQGSSLDTSLASMVNALAAAKADAVLRSALLQVSAPAPTPTPTPSSGLEALLQSVPHATNNPYGSILDNLDLARALGLTPSTRAPMSNLSLLRALVRETHN